MKFFISLSITNRFFQYEQIIVIRGRLYLRSLIWLLPFFISPTGTTKYKVINGVECRIKVVYCLFCLRGTLIRTNCLRTKLTSHCYILLIFWNTEVESYIFCVWNCAVRWLKVSIRKSLLQRKMWRTGL